MFEKEGGGRTSWRIYSEKREKGGKGVASLFFLRGGKIAARH